MGETEIDGEGEQREHTGECQFPLGTRLAPELQLPFSSQEERRSAQGQGNERREKLGERRKPQREGEEGGKPNPDGEGEHDAQPEADSRPLLGKEQTAQGETAKKERGDSKHGKHNGIVLRSKFGTQPF